MELYFKFLISKNSLNSIIAIDCIESVSYSAFGKIAFNLRSKETLFWSYEDSGICKLDFEDVKNKLNTYVVKTD